MILVAVRAAPHWLWGSLLGLVGGIVPGIVLLLVYGEGAAMLWALVVVIAILFAWVRME